MASPWVEIFTALTVFTLAVVSPGPNLLLVLNRTMAHSRRTGLYTALRVATGSAIFALIGLLGLMVLISTLPHFSLISRFVGGSYLAWLGFGMLRSSLSSRINPLADDSDNVSTISHLHAYRNGLLSNLTNPKAWAFYLSLFALVISPTIPFWGKALLNLSIFFIALTWYALAVMLVSNRLFSSVFQRFQILAQGGG